MMTLLLSAKGSRRGVCDKEQTAAMTEMLNLRVRNSLVTGAARGSADKSRSIMRVMAVAAWS
jgi:hypothetical protein